MTQQDTQPPAETLADIRAAADFMTACTAYLGDCYMKASLEIALREAFTRHRVAALTRRAGGDAIPAGWQLVPIALPDEMAIAGAKGRQNSAISSFRDGWKYALAATPKPPAGGDARVEP